MPNDFNFEKGIYAVTVSRLRVRTTKVAQVVTNYARDEQGNPIVFTEGMKMPVYRIEYSPQGWVWGVVSPHDAPHVQYSCLWDKQTLYAQWVKPFDVPYNEPPPVGDIGVVLMKLDNLETDLQQVKSKLDELLKR
jgi:hypothetical protein